MTIQEATEELKSNRKELLDAMYHDMGYINSAKPHQLEHNLIQAILTVIQQHYNRQINRIDAQLEVLGLLSVTAIEE